MLINIEYEWNINFANVCVFCILEANYVSIRLYEHSGGYLPALNPHN